MNQFKLTKTDLDDLLFSSNTRSQITGTPVESIDLIPNNTEVSTLKQTIDQLSRELKCTNEVNRQQVEVNSKQEQQIQNIIEENEALKEVLADYKDKEEALKTLEMK